MSTITWTGTNGGTWQTATDWSGGAVPTGADQVTITAPGTYSIMNGAPRSPIR